MKFNEFEINTNFKIAFADNFNIQSKYKCFSIIEKNENISLPSKKSSNNITTLKKTYDDRYKTILNNLKRKKVYYRSNAIVWICQNCGYTHIGIDAPLICPICNLPQNYFELQAN